MNWPTQLPPLTADEAVTAARRLYRFAMGETWTGKVKLTSGRNHTWIRDGVFYVNPTGWKPLLEDLSWLFFSRANPDAPRRSKDILRLHKKLLREIVKRGWLTNGLKTRRMPPDVQIILDNMKKENKELKKLETGVKRWTTKLARAQTMLAKYERKLKRYHGKGKA
jgi:hypothetical protein